MEMKVAALFGLIALVSTSGAHADCVYPKAPDTVPNGNTATKEEMIAAMQLFKQYNTDLTAYTACLESETGAKLKEASLSPEAMMQVKKMQARKNNAAVEEVRAKAEEFNNQVRIFKSRST